MKFLIKRLFVLPFLFALSSLNGQNGLGLQIGDFNAPYSYSLNPASSLGNPNQRIYINWWGGAVNLENNFMQYNAPFRLGDWTSKDYPQEYQDVNGNLSFDQSWLPVNTDKNVFKLNYLSEVYGPSFWVPVSNVGMFGFGMREVSGFSLNGVNGTFGGILRYGERDLKKNAGKTINQDEFSVNTEKYQEFAFNWAGYAPNDGENVFKYGLTGKILVGMGMAHLGSDNLNFRVSNDAESIDINQFNGRLLRTTVGNLSTLSRPFGMSFDFIEGVGTGIDLGMVYERRPNGGIKFKKGGNWCELEKSQGYDWKLGVSLTDVGFIFYEGNTTEILSTSGQQWDVDRNILQSTQRSENEDRLQSIETALFNELGAVENGFFGEFYSTTPAALNVQLDRYLGGKLHVGAYWTQNLKRRNSVGLRRSSYLSVSPRWQTENWEYGFPVTLANDYTTLHVGAYARFGPVIIGTDNLVGINDYLQNNKYTGGSFYFGVRSKIGGCDKRTDRYTYIQRELLYDTVRETVTITKVVKDTVVEVQNEKVKIPNTEELARIKAISDENDKMKDSIDFYALELVDVKKKCRENDQAYQVLIDSCNRESNKLKNKAEIDAKEIKRKEDEIYKWRRAYEDVVSSGKDAPARNAQIRINELEKQKKTLEYRVLRCQKKSETIISLKDSLEKECDKEKKSLQLYIDKLTLQIADLKKEKAKIEAERDILKDQVDRLSESSKEKPCDELIQVYEEKLTYEKKKNAEIEAELDKKRKENSDRIKSNDSLVNELSRAKSDAQLWKSKFEDLRKQLALKDCSPLERKIKEQEIEIERLRKLLKSSEITASEDCTPLRERIKELEKLNEELKDSLNTVKSKLSVSEEAEKACEKRIETLRKATSLRDCKPLENEIALLKAKVNELQKQLDRCGKDKSAIEMDLADTRNAKDSIQKQLQVKLQNCGKAWDSIKNELGQCKRELEKCKKSNSGIEVKPDDNNRLRDSLEQALKAKTKSQIELSKMKAEKSLIEKRLRDSIQTLTNESKINEEKLKGLLNDCEKKSAEILAESKRTSSELKKKEDELSRLKIEYQKCLNDKNSNDASALKITILEIESQKKAMEEQLIALQSKLEASEREAKDLKAKLDAANKKVSELKNASKQDCSQIEAELQKMKEEVNGYKSEINELKAKVAESGTGSSALTNEIESLKNQLNQKNTELTALNKKNEDCLIEVTRLQAELDRSKEEKKGVLNDYDALKKQVVSMDDDMAKLGEIIKTNNTELSNLRAEIDGLHNKLKSCNEELKTLKGTPEETPEPEEEVEDPGN